MGMKPKLMTTLTVSCALGGMAVAGNPHPAGMTGQPNQSCQVTMVTPGHSVSARGSAFNPTGVSGKVYAGTQAVNSKNPKSVSQYDVACFQQTARVAAGHKH